MLCKIQKIPDPCMILETGCVLDFAQNLGLLLQKNTVLGQTQFLQFLHSQVLRYAMQAKWHKLDARSELCLTGELPLESCALSNSTILIFSQLFSTFLNFVAFLRCSIARKMVQTVFQAC